MFTLTGRVALITGAGQGVGAEIARALADCGATVVVNDLLEERASRVASTIQQMGGRAFAVTADVTSEEAVSEMVAAARRAVGVVDVLVNNAGLPIDGLVRRNFVETEPADWAPLITLNLQGVLVCTRAVLPAMLDRGWGRIITIVSDAGRTGEPGMAAYSAAKAGAMGFSRALAQEVGPAGVTSNCLSLGAIQPPGAPDDQADAVRGRRYPRRRLGTPEDVAGAVVWLASPAGDWVTGQTVSVNGGFVTT